MTTGTMAAVAAMYSICTATAAHMKTAGTGRIPEMVVKIRGEIDPATHMYSRMREERAYPAKQQVRGVPVGEGGSTGEDESIGGSMSTGGGGSAGDGGVSVFPALLYMNRRNPRAWVERPIQALTGPHSVAATAVHLLHIAANVLPITPATTSPSRWRRTSPRLRSSADVVGETGRGAHPLPTAT